MIEPGAYVLATNYADGYPAHQFCVGFFCGMLQDRYLVDDGHGVLYNKTGFSRCEPVSGEIGGRLVDAVQILIDMEPGKSIWWWRDHPKELFELLTEYEVNKKGA